MNTVTQSPLPDDTRLVRRQIIWVVLINLFVIGIACFSLIQGKAQYEAQALLTTQNLSQVLDEDLSGIFSKIDIALQAVSDEMEHELRSGGIRKAELDSAIIRHHSRLPELTSLRATDASGDAIYGKAVVPAKTTSLAHRDYFALLRDTPDAGMVISKPLIGGISGKWMLVFARRISAPDGSFAGVVYAGVGLDYLTKIFRELNVGQNGSIALIDADHTLLARHPAADGSNGRIGQKYASRILSDLIASGNVTASYTAISAIDGTERRYSFRRLTQRNNLFIVTGLSTGDYLGKWRADVSVLSLVCAVFGLVTVASSRMIVRELRRTRDARQQLSQLNSELERRVSERTAEAEHTSQVLQSIVELMSDWVWETDSEWRYVFCSPHVETFLGYTPAEMLGKRPFDFMSDEESAGIRSEFSDSLRDTRQIKNRENWRIAKNGSRVRILTSAVTLFDSTGRVTGYRGINSDITQLKRAEEQLHMLSQVVEQSPSPIMITDDSGSIEYVNSAFTTVTGYSSSEALGRNAGFLNSGRTPETVVSGMWETLNHGRTWKGEFINCRKDGQIYWESAVISPFRAKDGSVTRYLAIKEDVTLHKQSEEALRESNERFYNMFNKAPAMMVITSPDDGICFDANQRFCDVSGISRNEILGRSLIDAGLIGTAEQDRIRDAIRANGQVYDLDLTVRSRTGRQMIWKYSGHLIMLGGEEYLLSSATDVTEQRAIEQRLMMSQKLEAIGQLAGGVAHDFNNKLMVILGFVELARLEMDDPASVLTYLDEICNAAEHSRQITMQLLGFSRQQVVMPLDLDINLCISRMMKSLSRLIGENITCSFTPGGALGAVRIDPVQFDQIVMNMAVNARDALPNGGTFSVVTSMVTRDAQQCRGREKMSPGEYVCIAFRDNGTGMPEETLEHIFEPFFTTKGPGKGTGLGLATIHGIVTQNGGTIDVQSTPGEGTEFTVCFPCRSETAAGSESAAEQLQEGSGSILLVEDEAPLREMAALFLKKAGYTVYPAAGPAQALEIAADSSVALQLVLTDIIMPEMDGITLVKRLREMRPDIRAFYVSGYSSDQAALEGLIHDGNFMQKPYDLFKLSRILKEAMSGRETADGVPDR